MIERYAAIKRENVVLSDGDIDRYVALKAAFVAEVLTEARRARTMEPVTYWKPESTEIFGHHAPPGARNTMVECPRHAVMPNSLHQS